MPSELIRRSHRENSNQIHKVGEWLTRHGILFDNTRFNLYVKDAKAVAKAHEGGETMVLLKSSGFPRLMNSLFEASEFSDLYEGLSTFQSSHLVTTLKECLAGSILTIDETHKNNRARNILFELTIASSLNRIGMSVQISPPADLWSNYGCLPLVIECKRPMSYKKFAERFKEGIQQLYKRYDALANPNRVRGLLAISISKAENAGASMIEAQTLDDLHHKVNGIVNSFTSRFRYLWDPITDKRMLGLIIYFKAPTVLKEPSLLNFYRQYIVVSFADPGTPEQYFMRNLGSRLERAQKGH